MPDRGVIYMCWGDPAIHQAEASMKSLWKFAKEMPVLVVGDKAACDHFKGSKQVSTRECKVDPFGNQGSWGFMAGRIKPLLYKYSPFEQSLYVDAETEFKRNPAIGFDLLDKWDLVIAEAETRSLGTTFPQNHNEADKTAAWLKTPHILYHNSGLIFWRKSQPSEQLFEAWSREWLRYKGWDEQIALLRALLTTPDILWLNVPFTWNCRGPIGAWMVYHRFASRAARKYQSGRIVGPRGNRGLPMAPARPMVNLEISPGRFVKCYAGDEEKVMEKYRKMSPGLFAENDG